MSAPDSASVTDTTAHAVVVQCSCSSLNGGKTKPLTDHSKGVLRDLLHRPKPLREINAGVRDRLARGGWVRVIEYASPYAKHKGGTCQHLALNESGREFAAAL
jgi:hypothetical protein